MDSAPKPRIKIRIVNPPKVLAKEPEKLDPLPPVRDRIVGKWYLYRHESLVQWDGKYLRCQHNRQKCVCKDCKGSSICDHDRIRSACKYCKGALIPRENPDPLN
jgi:hypothetical protein